MTLTGPLLRASGVSLAFASLEAMTAGGRDVGEADAAIFFQGNDLRLAFFAFLPYNAVAIALLLLLRRLDLRAAWAFAPYVAYLIYANIWGYGVWRANTVL